MASINHERKRIFIWVPGTGGHEPHPSFEAAVDMICGEDAQILHVEYPATWDMENSVPAGVKAFKELVEEIRWKIDYTTQEVYVGGSSQGAWVISEAYKDPEMRSFAKKTVMFGHPGLAEVHDHIFEADEDILEVNHPDDAVTYGWGADRKKMVDDFSRAQHGDAKAILSVLWLAICHPIRLFRFAYLIAIQAGIITWNTSPHDYSQQMPMAVYWLIH
jgi:hypothetical protein